MQSKQQKTAYEIGVRLVGSEMCIRDRSPANGEEDNNIAMKRGVTVFCPIDDEAVSYTHLTLPTNREV